MGTQVIGGMIPDPPWPARAACAKWAHTNKGDLDSYPNLREVHDDVVRRFSNIVFGSKYPGMMTSGATESNILALLYWRKQGKKRVVAFPHTHYSVRKAAYILGLEYVETDYAKLASKVKNSDVIVVTLGTTETGAVDPLNEIAELASRRGAVVHVDAAYYGTILRHSNRVESIELGLDDTISTIYRKHRLQQEFSTRETKTYWNPSGSSHHICQVRGSLDYLELGRDAPYMQRVYH